MRLLRPIVLAAALLLAVRPVRADVVTLDDGSKIEGEIVLETPQVVKLKIPYGSTTFPRSRVVKIERKPSPTQEWKDRLAHLNAKDAAGRLDLARWALDNHFGRDKAATLAIEAWRLEPGAEGAIDLLVRKLDFHFERDAWLDADHWYPTHGFVRRNGNFVTTDEVRYEDAVAHATALRAELASAEGAVRYAEDVIATFPAREARGAAEVADLKGQLVIATSCKDSAKGLLDSRNTDLGIAGTRTANAARDLAFVQQSCPGGDSSAAQACLDQARVAEANARRARDQALGAFRAAGAEEARLACAARDAQGALDAARAQARDMTSDLPRRKDASTQAAVRLTAGQSEVVADRRLADERLVHDAADAAARIEALRALKGR